MCTATAPAQHSPTYAAIDAPPPQLKRPQPEAVPRSQRERAAEQLRQQEHQRIFGIIPNFNTSNISDAEPLSSKQKFHLMIRGAIDPFAFFSAASIAGLGQAVDSHVGYGQGVEGYFKRYGAAYADSFDGDLWGNAILPSLLHQDPRYFRKGTGKVWSRVKYSVLTAVWTRNDNGSHGPNYSNVMGNFIAGGISNLYYPSQDRGLELTLQGATIVTSEGALASLGLEFWPDLAHKFLHTPNLTSSRLGRDDLSVHTNDSLRRKNVQAKPK